ncbi:MAG: TrkH family potassium uptake protein [Dethiobacteria bacterium]|nr:potassium transporter TrkG [Bacillota bacterium]
MAVRKKLLNPARVMALGFMGLILSGSLLLSLPPMTEGSNIAYIDALFTAASAVCVTGLVVVDTGTFYTPLGHVVIMFLIFCGSLGFMTMATLIFVFLGRKITLSDRLLVKEALNQDSVAGLVRLVLTVVRMAVFFILLGTIAMSFRFIPQLGIGEGIFFSLFHAVSAFGNAGFDIFGNYESLARMPADYLVNGTIMTLFIIGGLGFTVILELARHIRHRERISLHSRLVLLISAVLLAGGTVIILLLEYNNPATMGSLSAGGKLFTALFTAATPRTAGFNVLDTASLSYPTILILMGLMFIGASPTSTGGGVKTTTFGIVFFTFINMIRGRQEPVVFSRVFSISQIMKAISIISAAVGLIFIATFVMALFENHEFSALLFEAFSAFGTVGLSRGITPELSSASKVALMLTMFSGRIGPLTLMVALARRKEADVLHYPEEHILIG